MIELSYAGDIFNLPGKYEAVCVTTNGAVKRNGELAMGKGIALSAAQKYPELPKIFGQMVSQYGNHAYMLPATNKNGLPIHIISFPTKRHFKYNSEMSLILQSAKEIVKMADMYDFKKIYMVRPGCGCGKLDWHSQVKNPLSHILDDRFIVVNPN